MYDDENSADYTPNVLTMQIIAGSLIGGVVLFAVITVVIGAWEPPERPGFLKYMGLILVAMIAVPFVIVPRQITRQNIAAAPSSDKPGDDQTAALLGVYQVRMIIRYALLEGATFFNLIAFMTEHARWSLGVAGLLVLAMLAMFPTRTRVEHWLENQQLAS